MRLAVVSDIHGNLTAFEAVLTDLKQAAPDLVLHGGDLANAGSSPVEIVDRIRDLGWQGVVGNTDEMLFRPESLDEFASHSKAPASLWAMIREMAAVTRSLLGEERISWLRSLPRVQIHAPLALVHASPADIWRAPMPEADNSELESTYASLAQPIAVYGHIHRSYIRELSDSDSKVKIIVNAGSVSLSHDGDPRASYLLLEDEIPTIRRIEYDIEKEVQALSESGMPHADWIAKTLRTGRP